MPRTSVDKRYQSSHPWISFQLRIESNRLWSLLGEALSKSNHLAGTPLKPHLADKMARAFLIRGAVATAAIEGNTLTVDQVEELDATGRKLPESQAYLQQEVDNVLRALRGICEDVEDGMPFTLTTSWIKQQNAVVLDQVHDLEDHITPGVYTERQLVVGNYRAAPPEDVDFLMEQLVEWLDEAWLRPARDPAASADLKFFNSFFAATLAHLYIAWIHPFGDGNGRTARLVECAILAHSGIVPWISSNLLSDHYNRTRSRYYSMLDRAREDEMAFLTYSAQGFVDMLREQIEDVQRMQREVAWINYVHEVIGHETAGETQRRRRDLILAMPEAGMRRQDIPRLTPHLAALYATKQEKTVTRDVNRLKEIGLLRQRGALLVPQIARMDAFKPSIAHAEASE